MREYGKGLALGLLINGLTVLGWFYIGPLIPAAANALLALIILGLYGLEEKWAFPFGYWTVELLFVIASIVGMGGIFQLAGG